jgi:beta-glucosidase
MEEFMPLKRPSAKLCLLVAVFFLSLHCLISLAAAQSDGKSHPWMNSSLSPDERASLVVKEMTLDEKI